jgi:N6-adenosine-specific RNA methylase IME4
MEGAGKVEWSTALMDPPWLERGAGKIRRGADKHYSLLKTREMPEVIQGSGFWTPAQNAHLYLWSTSNFLPDALWLMDALGFAYKTNLVWVKDRIGIGRYFRGKHELLLFGTRGRGWDVRTERNDLPSALHAPHVMDGGKRKHSAKPDDFYGLIESRSRGPYAEFFARSSRPGWSSWGDGLSAVDSTDG